MALVWQDTGDGNWELVDDGSDNIDVGGGWNPAAGFNDSTAADNIDVGGGWNPATGTGDRATADAAAATGVTTSAGLPAASGINWSNLPSALKSLFVKPDGSVNTGVLGAVLGGLGGAAGLGQVSRAPTGYQGGIPQYTAVRQAAAPGQRLSGNVTYTKKAEGGLLESGGFVIPADVVSHFGNGSSDAGLKLLAAKLGAEPIRGEGDGMSDSIPTTIDGHEPAKVAHEEAFVSRDKVAQIGGGDPRKGAQKLRDMMARIREARTGSEEQGKQINPNKFMPGGAVKGYAAGDVTSSALSAGLSGSESNLSNWAGPYVTDMLGKGQALSEMPFEQYGGPLTAGPSALQTQAFGQASQNLANPYTAVGSDFTSPGVAQQYMNPYLQSALEPQLAEMKRQADIKRMEDAGRLTKAGAYGGSRQAIMESEGARNLMDMQRRALGEGYSTAYDKAMAQFNADQSRKVQEAQFGTTAGQQGIKTLADLGATQRGIESEGIAADKAQFEEARANPYKMVQFQQSLLSGLPLAAQSYNVAQPSTLQQILSGIGGGASLGGLTSTDLNTALKNLKII